MEQHPVPQHIASYEFRLVGDMTIKQFGWLSAGIALALAFYALPIPSLFKWPLVLFSGFTGAAFAFMPFEERPLSAWCLAFYRAVVSPTQFLWQKKATKPQIFAPIHRTEPLAKTPFVPADKNQLGEYLRTLPGNESKNLLDQKEEKFLQQIASFTAHVPPTSYSIQQMPTRKSPAEMPVQTPPTATSPQPLAQMTKAPPSIDIKKRLDALDVPNERIASVRKPGPIILPEAPGRPKKPSFSAKISPNLPIPTTPTRPNILVGMLLDNQGSLIEGAILEVRNSKGMPVRALKTNKLGQFMIATPLENDTYEIETEKEGLEFDIIKIEVKGEIIPPIEIRAK